MAFLFASLYIGLIVLAILFAGGAYQYGTALWAEPQFWDFPWTHPPSPVGLIGTVPITALELFAPSLDYWDEEGETDSGQGEAKIIKARCRALPFYKGFQDDVHGAAYTSERCGKLDTSNNWNLGTCYVFPHEIGLA